MYSFYECDKNPPATHILRVLGSTPDRATFTQGMKGVKISVDGANYFRKDYSGKPYPSGYYCFDLVKTTKLNPMKFDSSEFDFVNLTGTIYTMPKRGTLQRKRPIKAGALYRRFKAAAVNVVLDSNSRPVPADTIGGQNAVGCEFTNWTDCEACSEGDHAKVQITVSDKHDAGARIAHVFLAKTSFDASSVSFRQFPAPFTEIRNTNEKLLEEAPNNVYVIEKWDFNCALIKKAGGNLKDADAIHLTRWVPGGTAGGAAGGANKAFPNFGDDDMIPYRLHSTVRKGAGGDGTIIDKGTSSGWKKGDDTIYGNPGTCDFQCVHESQICEIKSNDEPMTNKDKYFVKGKYFKEMCRGAHIEWSFFVELANCKKGASCDDDEREPMGTFTGIIKGADFKYNALLGFQLKSPTTGSKQSTSTTLVRQIGQLTKKKAEKNILFDIGISNQGIGRLKGELLNVKWFLKEEGAANYVQITTIVGKNVDLFMTKSKIGNSDSHVFTYNDFSDFKEAKSKVYPMIIDTKKMIGTDGFVRGDYKIEIDFKISNLNCASDKVISPTIQLMFNLPSSQYIPEQAVISP